MQESPIDADAKLWSICCSFYGFASGQLLMPPSVDEEMPITMRHLWTTVFPHAWESSSINCVPREIESTLAECGAVLARMEEEFGKAGALERLAVEYAALFVGPPSPAAPPWETFYRGEGATVGFGAPTFEMRELFRKAGLAVAGDNNQYEDHMGLELALLYKLCERIVRCLVGEGLEEGVEENELATPQGVVAYLEAHPLSWIDGLIEKCAAAYPDGYYCALLRCVKAHLCWQKRRLG